MKGSLIPLPVSLEQFHRDAQAIPETMVRVLPIPDLLSRFLQSPPARGFETRRAVYFDRKDFTRQFLDEEELARLNRFKVLKKQVEWSCGRFAAKSLVREILMPDKALSDIRINYRDQGAPFLEAMPDHTLTLSHSGQMTALALSQVPGPVLGIDIEKVGPMPDKSFMTTAFTRQEIEVMAPCPGDVFRCWTLKEAYLKFIGKGFNESLHTVEILGNTVHHAGEAQPVSCRSWHLEPGYMLGLVTGQGAPPTW